MANSPKHRHARVNDVIIYGGSVYYLATLTVPLLAQVANAYVTMAVSVFLCMFIVATNPNRYFALLLSLSSMLVLDGFNRLLNDTDSLPLFVYGRVIWVAPALLSYFTLQRRDQKLTNTVLWCIIGGLFVTSVTSFIALQSDPGAARFAATISDSRTDYAISMNMRNIGGFGIVYTIVALYPMIVCLFKYRIITTWRFVLLTVAYGAYIISAQYAIATILFTGGLLTLVYNKRFGPKRFALLVIVAIMMVLVFRPVMASLFYDAASGVASTTLSERLQYVGDLLSGVDPADNASAFRFQLYQRSIQTFWRSSFFGAWSLGDESAVGGHSFVLDVMARYGLIGLLAIITIYYQIHRRFYSRFSSEPFYGYMLYSLFGSICLALVNPIDSLVSIALVVPLAGYTLQNKIACMSNGVPKRLGS